MSESNSLRQVRRTDIYYLKSVMNVFFEWYLNNCQEITDLAEYFGEDDDDVVTSILSAGLDRISERRDMMQEAKMQRGDQL